MDKGLIELLIPSRSINMLALKPEQAICVEFANEVRRLSLENKLPYVWFHIPNEFLPSTRVNYSFELKQKHMGKIAGVPDYCFIGKDRSFFIEFKAGKSKQTETQKYFEEWCENMGIEYYLCRNHKDALEIVNKTETKHTIKHAP